MTNNNNRIANSAVLSVQTLDVEEINKRIVELFDETTRRIYTCVDSIKNCNNGEINEGLSPENLNTLSPPHELCLRTNCVVIFIRNISIKESSCNGTIFLILELGNYLLRCRIWNGDNSGEIVFIKRIILYCENVYPFTFKRKQFPIKLAFAMTINKSRGRTF